MYDADLSAPICPLFFLFRVSLGGLDWWFADLDDPLVLEGG